MPEFLIRAIDWCRRRLKRGDSKPLKRSPGEVEVKNAAREARPPQHKSDLLVDLNFKVDEAFRTEFKMVSVAWRMSNKDFLERTFREWVAKHGARPPDYPGKR